MKYGIEPPPHWQWKVESTSNWKISLWKNDRLSHFVCFLAKLVFAVSEFCRGWLVFTSIVDPGDHDQLDTGKRDHGHFLQQSAGVLVRFQLPTAGAGPFHWMCYDVSGSNDYELPTMFFCMIPFLISFKSRTSKQTMGFAQWKVTKDLEIKGNQKLKDPASLSERKVDFSTQKSWPMS